MRGWLSGALILTAGMGSASGQEPDADPYEQLRAPAMAAYEAGETARAYTLFEEVFAEIPESDPAERAATAFSLGILAHQSEERIRALAWLDQGFLLHAEAGTPPADYANYLSYAGTISLEANEPELAIGYLRRTIEALPDTPEMLEARASAFNALANALNATGQYYEASERRRNALAAYMEVHGLDHAYVGIVLEGLASDVEPDGHIGQAIDARRDALRIALTTREPGDLTVVTLAGQLADLFITDGNPDGLRRTADMVQALGGRNRHSARILSELASRASQAGETRIMADLHARAFEAASADDETPGEFMATYLLNHATGVQGATGYAEALPWLEEHYELVRSQDGEPGLLTAAASERVWTALFRMARFAEAEANARERLEALNARADYPADQIGRAYENLALSIHEQYRPNEAGPVFARALEVLEPNSSARGTLASLLDAYAIHLAYNEDRSAGLEMARRNAGLRAELYGADSAAYGRGLTTRATIERLSGMTSEALTSLSEAETLYEALGETSAQARIDVMIQRAQISFEQGLLPQAEAILARADGLISPARADQRRDWHDAMGRVRRTQGRLTDALGHFRESLALRIAQDGEAGRASVFPLLQIAMTLRMQENLEEAEAMTRRALAIHESFGITSGNDVGIAWGELASILSLQGRTEESLAASERANALIADAWPRGTQRRALQDYNHALLVMRSGNYADAEPGMRQAIADFGTIEGRSDAFLGTMVNTLGYLLEQQGEYRQAAVVYREGMELRESQMSNDNPAVASSRAFLARVLIEHLGEAREGLDLYRAASNGLIEGIEMRAGTAAEEGVDGVEFAQKDAFFTAHLEALWTNAHAN